jgi:hypothetical protein
VAQHKHQQQQQQQVIKPPALPQRQRLMLLLLSLLLTASVAALWTWVTVLCSIRKASQGGATGIGVHGPMPKLRPQAPVPPAGAALQQQLAPAVRACLMLTLRAGPRAKVQQGRTRGILQQQQQQQQQGVLSRVTVRLRRRVREGRGWC